MQHPIFLPKRTLALFCAINVITYLDRGVIAANAVKQSIATEFGLSNAQYFLLPSIFMVGLLLASPVFAQLTRTTSPLKLIGASHPVRLHRLWGLVTSLHPCALGHQLPRSSIASLSLSLSLHCCYGHWGCASVEPLNATAGVGLTAWMVAVIGCGAAPGYYALIVCRMLVGVGEASFCRHGSTPRPGASKGLLRLAGYGIGLTHAPSRRDSDWLLSERTLRVTEQWTRTWLGFVVGSSKHV
jgi:MFS family permease